MHVLSTFPRYGLFTHSVQVCIPVGAYRPFIDRMLASASRGRGGVCSQGGSARGGVVSAPGGGGFCSGGGGVICSGGWDGIPPCTEADPTPCGQNHRRL